MYSFTASEGGAAEARKGSSMLTYEQVVRSVLLMDIKSNVPDSGLKSEIRVSVHEL